VLGIVWQLLAKSLQRNSNKRADKDKDSDGGQRNVM